MSRWIEGFEAHAFQVTWLALKESLDTSTVDDETVITTLKELARLKKVIAYLDEMIHSIDPELVPLTTWDNFNSQSAACNQNITQYNSDRNIGHIQQANTHADNLLTYIRPYMIAEGKAGKALQKSLKEYAKTIDQYGEQFRDNSVAIVEEIKANNIISKELLALIENNKTLIEEFSDELFSSNNIDDGLQAKIRQLFEDISEKYQKINEYYDETLIGSEDELSTKKMVSQAKEDILSEQEKINTLLVTVSDEVKDLDKFHIKVFGQLIEDESKSENAGLSGKLNALIQAVIDFEKEQKIKYTSLNEEIESLLPGATSVGLATAYKEMKDSFDKPIKHASKVFYGSLGLLLAASFYFSIETVGGDNWITFMKFNDWDLVLKGMVNKLPFYAPILWLAYYATKRRSEYQRLEQEYAHKESLAKSYNNYNKQIQKLGDKDNLMQKEFIMKAIDAIAYNASETLDKKHGDKILSHDVIEKIIETINTKK